MQISSTNLENCQYLLNLNTAAAAAKLLQSCPTLCDPTDSSPPGSPVPGILQARTLEWVAISFSNAWKWKVKVKSLRGSSSHLRILSEGSCASRHCAAKCPLTENKRYTCSWKGKLAYAKNLFFYNYRWTQLSLWDLGWNMNMVCYGPYIQTYSLVFHMESSLDDWQPQSKKKMSEIV